MNSQIRIKQKMKNLVEMSITDNDINNIKTTNRNKKKKIVITKREFTSSKKNSK